MEAKEKKQENVSENEPIKKSKIMLAWEKHEPLITKFDRKFALL